jgi:lysophospholipase L1-like esterase
VTILRSRAAKPIFLACATVLLSTGFALLLAEGALRAYWVLKDWREQSALPGLAKRALVPSADPELRYEFNPGWTRSDFSVNAFGMADDEISREKPPGVFRIAFVGDSITANFELAPRPAIYVNQLEQRLNRDTVRARSFESLNFAVNGYGILQTARMLRTRVRAFDPDVVVLQLCLNDPYPSDSAYTRDAPIGPSRLYNFLYRRVDPVSFWGWWYVGRTYDATGLANLRRGFEAIAEEARRGPPMLAVVFPYLYKPAYERWGYARFHELYRDAAREAGVPLLDLYEPFERSGFVGMRPYPADPIHPDLKAHALASEAIIVRLDELGVLPPLRSAPLAGGPTASAESR